MNKFQKFQKINNSNKRKYLIIHNNKMFNNKILESKVKILENKVRIKNKHQIL